MRIMGFSIDWPKLKQQRFTTFRFERKDRDWYVGELVQVKVKPRSKGGGEGKGVAVIVSKVHKSIENISEAEAIADGFNNWREMWEWFKPRCTIENIGNLNKLTLEWVKQASP